MEETKLGGLTKICKEEYLNMADGVIKRVLVEK